MVSSLMESIPLEIWVKISHNLSPRDTFHTALASKFLWKTLTVDEIWRHCVEKEFFYRFYNPKALQVDTTDALKQHGSYYELFKAQMQHMVKTEQIIDDIIKFESESVEYRNEHEDSVSRKLENIYNSWQETAYVFVKEVRHMDESYYDPETSLMLTETFEAHQRLRNENLKRIALAARILTIGNTLSYERSFRTFDYGGEGLEDTFLKASMLDPNYSDILRIRHRVLTETIEEYKAKFIDQNDHLNNAILIGNIFLQKLAKYRRNIFPKVIEMSDLLVDQIPVYLSRLYAGEASVKAPLCYLVIANLCRMVGIKGVKSSFPLLKLRYGEKELFLTPTHREDTTLKVSSPQQFVGGVVRFDEDPEDVNFKDLLLNAVELSTRLPRPVTIEYQDIPNLNKKAVVLKRKLGTYGSVLTYGGLNDNIYAILKDRTVGVNASGRHLDENSMKVFLERLNIVSRPLYVITDGIFSITTALSRKPLQSEDVKFKQSAKIKSVIGGFTVGDIAYSHRRSAYYTIISIDRTTFNRENIRGSFRVMTFGGEEVEVNDEPIYTLFSGDYEKVKLYADEIEKRTDFGAYQILHSDEIGQYFSHFDFKEYRFMV